MCDCTPYISMNIFEKFYEIGQYQMNKDEYLIRNCDLCIALHEKKTFQTLPSLSFLKIGHQEKEWSFFKAFLNLKA
jgi:hypothetical protein